MVGRCFHNTQLLQPEILRAAGPPAADRQAQRARYQLGPELLTEYSVVPLGLWNDMRLPSFFSGVFFWPVSESKRGKVRITFMFLSPQPVRSRRFPAPWVDSSFVNSERAGQPAIWAVSAGPLPRSLSHSLAVLALSLSSTPSSLSLPLSIPSPRPQCGAATAAETLRLVQLASLLLLRIAAE